MLCHGSDELTIRPDGKCPDCGEPTNNGDAIEHCIDSLVVCETCQRAPCDGSCRIH